MPKGRETLPCFDKSFNPSYSNYLELSKKAHTKCWPDFKTQNSEVFLYHILSDQQTSIIVFYM
jgi:hypothetical protein